MHETKHVRAKTNEPNTIDYSSGSLTISIPVHLHKFICIIQTIISRLSEENAIFICNIDNLAFVSKWSFVDLIHEEEWDIYL